MNNIVKENNQLTLIVTEQCNLSCVYCYEHNKNSKQMTFDMAKHIIDDNFIDSKSHNYMIEFFGGEPFLNFDLIKNVVEYVKTKYIETQKIKTVHFFISTNGTLVHNEIKEWLKENRNIITCGLSFDGNAQAQNINRSNSFSKIDLDFFKTLYPNQPLKMTVSEQSLPFLADSIEYLSKKRFLIACNLAFMVDWFNPNNLTILREQLEKLIKFYLSNPETPKCTMFSFNLAILSHPKISDTVIKKFCGCGTNMKVYGTDGKQYPCQLFSPIAAENNAIESKNFHVEKNIPVELYPKECIECYFERICPFCLGSNYLSTGDFFKPDLERCKLNKMIFAANAKLNALEWEQGTLKCDDEQGLLRSILQIQELNI